MALYKATPDGNVLMTAEEEAEFEAWRSGSAKADRWTSIKIERDRRTHEGGYLVRGHWYHSDLISRSQQLALARKADRIEQVGGDMEAVFNIGGEPLLWKTMDGSFVPMNGRLAQEIVSAAEIQDTATFKAALVHKNAMESSGDPAAYDFLSSGWPSIYKE